MSGMWGRAGHIGRTLRAGHVAGEHCPRHVLVCFPTVGTLAAARHPSNRILQWGNLSPGVIMNIRLPASIFPMLFICFVVGMSARADIPPRPRPTPPPAPTPGYLTEQMTITTDGNAN